MVKWILWYSLLITQVILWLKVCLAASAVTILTDHCVCSLIFQSWVGCQREQTTVPQLTQKLVQIAWNTNLNMNLKVSEPKFMNIICCLFGNKDKRIIIQCKIFKIIVTLIFGTIYRVIPNTILYHHTFVEENCNI